MGQQLILGKSFHVTETSTTAKSTQPVLGEEGLQNRRLMTRPSQSRKDAGPPTPLLSSKKISRVGTWNVRTMYESGKAAQVAAELRNYNLSVLGVSETRWTQAGQTRLSTGELILYSGHEDEGAHHTEGVALVLAPQASKALLRWEPAGSRIISASFSTKMKKSNLNIIQCYAPTNDKDEEMKEEFYNRLQDTINKFKDKDITILMGDFNAKIGSDNKNYPDSMGQEGLGKMNENGEIFADFCESNKLVIGGSVFPHKKIHKATWISPDHRTENQIDHVCINKKFRSSLQDVRVQRGADVASDHHLVVCKLKLKLKKNHTPSSNRDRYNVNFLTDHSFKDDFTVTIQNKYAILQELLEDDETDVNTAWQQSKEIWTGACEEVLGKKKRHHKEWISVDTLKKIEERKKKKDAINSSRTRTGKAAAQSKYTTAHKEVRKSIRKDKKNFVDALASEAEVAAGKGNLKELYDNTRKLSGKFRKSDRPIKDSHGKTLTTIEDQLNRWANHFKELLNRPSPVNPPTIPPREQLPINIDVPSKEEIRQAIKLVKNGKAAGKDNIPGEALKADLETSTEILYHLFQKVWKTEQIPQDWKDGFIVKIPKKGDLSDCKNYRGITLLSIPGKVFNRIILERLRAAIDSNLRDEQAGFRKDRSCTDQIATLRIIVEQSIEWNSPLYVNFVDYEKAFDSVDRQTLWQILEHYGVPPKIVSLIKNIYNNTTDRVVHAGQLSEPFHVTTGVRQGCILSPFLFILAIDWIMRETTKDSLNGIQWTLSSQLNDLDFADDLALLSHNHQQMQAKTTKLDTTSTQTGLKIHPAKTKLMKINTSNELPIKLKDEPIEEVQSFVYLGSVINIQGGTDEDVQNRIQKARSAFIMLSKIWQSKTITLNTKLRIFNSNVKSVLLYGSETWRTTNQMLKKVQTFLNRCLRRILRIKWTDHEKNIDLWKKTQQDQVKQTILRRKWKWIGHTLRKAPSNMTRQALSWNPQGKRKRGRPKNTWRRDLEAELRAVNTTWSKAVREAQDRPRWKAVVDGLCSARS